MDYLIPLLAIFKGRCEKSIKNPLSQLSNNKLVAFYFIVALCSCPTPAYAKDSLEELITKFDASSNRATAFGEQLLEMNDRGTVLGQKRFCNTILLTENEIRISQKYLQAILLLNVSAEIEEQALEKQNSSKSNS